MKRPPGVTILAVMIFLSAVSLVGEALLLVSVAAGSSIAGFLTRAIAVLSMVADCSSHVVVVLAWIILPASLPFLVGIYAFLAVFFLVIGMALLRVQNWARAVIVVLAVLSIATGIVGFAIPQFLLFRQPPVFLVIDLVILVYLFQAKTKEVFGAKTL